MSLFVRLLVTKYLKIQFKVASLLSSLLCVDTTLPASSLELGAFLNTLKTLVQGMD